MDRTRARARELRRNLTDAERLLWEKLRYWQVDGCKFRHQQPLGCYIVDFVCLQKRLIVEVDGGQHAEQANYDSERDVWLVDQGFVVLRFWNNDVLNNMDGVLETIVGRLQRTPYLNPSPQETVSQCHSEPQAKNLLFCKLGEKQMLRFAQHDVRKRFAALRHSLQGGRKRTTKKNQPVRFGT